MNVLSEVQNCPHCEDKIRVNIHWTEDCEIDYQKRTHRSNIKLNKVQLYGGEKNVQKI